jgi:hypothetical protein
MRHAAKQHVSVETYQKTAPTCHGHLPKEDFSPPTIRDSGNSRRPHTERMSNVVLMGAPFIPLAASYACQYLHYCLAFPQKDLNLKVELVCI